MKLASAVDVRSPARVRGWAPKAIMAASVAGAWPPPSGSAGRRGPPVPNGGGGCPATSCSTVPPSSPPRRHHPGPTRPGVAVAGADGLAPRRLVHGTLGRPAAVPGQLAQRQPAPSRPAAAAAGRRPHPRRATRDGLVRGRAPRPAQPVGAALHHPPARRLAERLGAVIDWAWTFALDPPATEGPACSCGSGAGPSRGG
jgi:hypothetical protein